jgi:hypothetical protein
MPKRARKNPAAMACGPPQPFLPKKGAPRGALTFSRTLKYHGCPRGRPEFLVATFKYLKVLAFLQRGEMAEWSKAHPC